MKRSKWVLAVIALVGVGGLVALVDGVGLYQSASTIEPAREEAIQANQSSSEDSELTESSVVESQGSNGEHNIQGQEEDETQPVTVAPRTYSAEEIATSRKEIKEEITREVNDIYSLLIKDFGLNSDQKDALMSLLIESEIAATKTAYSSGEGLDEQELSDRIAAIVGDSNRQKFLALNRYRAEYAETQKVRSLLKQNEVPINDAQTDKLLKILVNVRNQVDTRLPADMIRGSMESLEHRIDQMELYERLVLERAPSVLSTKQVEHLFERYQNLSYRRAFVLEFQKKARADDPANEDFPTYYPPRN